MGWSRVGKTRGARGCFGEGQAGGPRGAGTDMKVLLHSCCAVCLGGVHEELARGGDEVAAFFYNPNVQGFLEFRKRLKAFRVLADMMR